MVIKKTDEEWRIQLSPEQFRVTRESGTERPFTGLYNDHSEGGVYKCICCDAELFVSATKFDSGCGWPSFDRTMDNDNVTFHRDESGGRVRTEVRCGGCEAHLGHVFEDGPTETGNRFCINSASLGFEKGA